MRQVVVVGFEKGEFETLEGQISTYLKLNTIWRESVDDAISLIDILPKLKLFILSPAIEATEFENLVKASKRPAEPIQVVALGSKESRYLNVTCLPDSCSPEQLMQTVAKLADAQITPIYQDEELYTPIPIHHFLGLRQVFCDVFIRISKLNQRPQFVKRIMVGDEFENELIERYMNDGLEYLYIPSEYKDNFKVYFSNRMIAQLQNEDLNEAYKVEVNSYIATVVRENVLNVGFDPITVEMTTACISSMLETVRSVPKLQELFDVVGLSESSYSFKLSLLTAATAHHMLLQLPWSKNEHRKKVTYAAFFKDIVLSDERLMKIRSLDQLETTLFSKEEKSLVHKHAFLSSVLIKHFEEMPAGVETLIKEHHGDKQGMTLKREPDAEICPLSRLLMIAEEFASRYLEAGHEVDLKQLFEELKPCFPQESFLKILRALSYSLP